MNKTTTGSSASTGSGGNTGGNTGGNVGSLQMTFTPSPDFGQHSFLVWCEGYDNALIQNANAEPCGYFIEPDIVDLEKVARAIVPSWEQ